MNITFKAQKMLIDAAQSAPELYIILNNYTIPQLQRHAVQIPTGTRGLTVMAELGSRPTKGQYIAGIVAAKFPTT